MARFRASSTISKSRSSGGVILMPVPTPSHQYPNYIDKKPTGETTGSFQADRSENTTIESVPSSLEYSTIPIEPVSTVEKTSETKKEEDKADEKKDEVPSPTIPYSTNNGNVITDANINNGFNTFLKILNYLLWLGIILILLLIVISIFARNMSYIVYVVGISVFIIIDFILIFLLSNLNSIIYITIFISIFLIVCGAIIYVLMNYLSIDVEKFTIIIVLFGLVAFVDLICIIMSIIMTIIYFKDFRF